MEEVNAICFCVFLLKFWKLPHTTRGASFALATHALKIM